MAKQIVIRDVSRELFRRLETLAEAKALSLSATVLGILEAAVGVGGRRARLTRSGTWTEQDCSQFDETLRAQRTVEKDDSTEPFEAPEDNFDIARAQLEESRAAKKKETPVTRARARKKIEP